jgi:fructoselysine-6-P-deglycase FrlB-like protein
MDQTIIEIHDTFKALKKTSDYLNASWGNVEAFFQGKKRYVFLGCGSSYSLAKSMAFLCSMNLGVPSSAMAAGDILLHADRYQKLFDGAGVVLISRSGRTSELLLALEALAKNGCKVSVASLVCADGTPLGEKSDLCLSTPWAFDESVCQTRSVTNFYFMGAYLFARLAGDKAVMADLDKVIAEGPAFLAKAETFAEKLTPLPWNTVMILADAELEGIAEEGSLAFKEICQLPSNYYHMLDVRHGPMVLVNKETLVMTAPVVGEGLEAGLIKDLRAKNAEMVTFSDVWADAEISFGSKLSHTVRGIPFILLCQLISYKKAGAVGTNPDKPDGLDPWIKL